MKKTLEISKMSVIGIETVIAVTIVYSQILNGFAFSVLWGWFVVPTFGCVALTIPAAIGIAMTFSYLAHGLKADDGKKPFSEKLIEAIIAGTLKPAFALLVGFVVKSFM